MEKNRREQKTKTQPKRLHRTVIKLRMTHRGWFIIIPPITGRAA